MAGAISQCKWCGRGVFWLKSEKKQKPTPIERIPTSDGNCAVDEERGTWRVVTTLTERAQLIGRLYRNHVGNCPMQPKRTG